MRRSCGALGGERGYITELLRLYKVEFWVNEILAEGTPAEFTHFRMHLKKRCITQGVDVARERKILESLARVVATRKEWRNALEESN